MVRKLIRLGWIGQGQKPVVEFDENGIYARQGSRRQDILWENIVRMRAQRMDKMTFEEIYLIFEDTTGQLISVGELEDGFEEVVDYIAERFVLKPTEWRDLLETECTDLVLYEVNEVNS